MGDVQIENTRTEDPLEREELRLGAVSVIVKFHVLNGIVRFCLRLQLVTGLSHSRPFKGFVCAIVISSGIMQPEE